MAAAKRARSEALTGGTGDVKPQILTIETTQAGAVDQYIVNTLILPVPRIGAMKDKATVLEILRVEFYPGMQSLTFTTGIHVVYLLPGAALRASSTAATETTTTQDIANPRTLASAIVFTTTDVGGGGHAEKYPVTVDMTDGAGNGVLVATDTITITGAGIGTAANGNYIAKILYRLVNVGIQEYVGIVQSQQG